MKIILLQDVAKVGKKFEIREVNSGFARNFLIARGRARAVTDNSKGALEKLKASLEGTQKLQQGLLEMDLEKINGLIITVVAKANDEGHLFASIHEKEIKEALKTQAHIDLPEDSLNLEKPLKTLGEHTVSILVGEKKADLKIVISRLQP